jgi:SPP1 gp7 family putative phage head morphogenesis protein
MKRARETGTPRGRSANDQLLAGLIRVRIELIRTEGTVMGERILPWLRQLERDLLADLESLPQDDELSRERAFRLLVQARAAIAAAVDGMRAAHRDALAQVSAGQVDRVLAAMTRATPPAVGAAISSTIDVDGVAALAARPMQDFAARWFPSWERDALNRVGDSLAQALLQGEDVATSARRVAGALDVEVSQVERLVRTTIATVGNAVYQRTYDSARDLIRGLQWVATLDDRTCPRCGPLDGQWWSYGPDADASGLVSAMPDTPLHPFCRCVRSPILKGAEELGFDLPPAQRASLNGVVPAALTWDVWQGTQDADEALIRDAMTPHIAIERIYADGLRRGVANAWSARLSA